MDLGYVMKYLSSKKKNNEIPEEDATVFFIYSLFFINRRSSFQMRDMLSLGKSALLYLYYKG